MSHTNDKAVDALGITEEGFHSVLEVIRKADFNGKERKPFAAFSPLKESVLDRLNFTSINNIAVKTLFERRFELFNNQGDSSDSPWEQLQAHKDVAGRIQCYIYSDEPWFVQSDDNPEEEIFDDFSSEIFYDDFEQNRTAVIHSRHEEVIGLEPISEDASLARALKMHTFSLFKAGYRIESVPGLIHGTSSIKKTKAWVKRLGKKFPELAQSIFDVAGVYAVMRRQHFNQTVERYYQNIDSLVSDENVRKFEKFGFEGLDPYVMRKYADYVFNLVEQNINRFVYDEMYDVYRSRKGNAFKPEIIKPYIDFNKSVRTKLNLVLAKHQLVTAQVTTDDSLDHLQGFMFESLDDDENHTNYACPTMALRFS